MCIRDRANIKHKKRVAALFKAPQKPEPVPGDAAPAEHVPVLAMAETVSG